MAGQTRSKWLVGWLVGTYIFGHVCLASRTRYSKCSWRSFQFQFAIAVPISFKAIPSAIEEDKEAGSSNCLITMDDEKYESPCRYYSFPTKSQRLCVFLKWKIDNSYRELKSYRIRPTPQCELNMSWNINNGIVRIFVENFGSCIHLFDSTTVICDLKGQIQYSEKCVGVELKNKRSNILPCLKNIYSNPLVVEIRLDIYKSIHDVWDVGPWERRKQMKLVEDMKNCISAELPAEVVLKSNDGNEISINKALLRARSSVFRKMFDHSLAERDTGIVSIDDASEKTVKTLVEFLGSGEANLCDTDMESLKELYYVADKYEVLDLREYCAQYMASKLTPGNAIPMLITSFQHSDDQLKKECLSYLRNPECVKTVIKTEDWMNLKATNATLALEVLETCFK